MNLKQYQERKTQQQSGPAMRPLCYSCLQPGKACYCHAIQRFDPGISFVLLIHPIEVRRRIATGRMTSLCLDNSHLISGQDFSENSQVNALIKDPANHCVILYPGADSSDLSVMNQTARNSLVPDGKRLTVFVIDGTWATAKKMMRESRNLHALPKICFSPDKPSGFRVRKQPRELCYSTIEAVHQTIDLLGGALGLDLTRRPHDNLLDVFDLMVERQLLHLRHAEEIHGPFNSRDLKARHSR
ncbi:tRNA-uridine aminocarboxypropyltransferase [Bdellovibrio bacteriovorus]|uniref:tRNA-uridine aminocarboxypropyltransferase n=1 Tax=Bdellovibrio bacteriovorus TaxID=959 RepID=UPI0035A5FDF0